MEIFRFSEAEKAFGSAIDALNDSKLSKDQKSKLKKDFVSQIEQAKKKYGLEKAVNDLMKNPSEAVPQEMRIPDPPMNPSSLRPALSEAVAVERDDLQGRHLVAVRDIKAGEVLAIDRPVVHALDHDRSLSNCAECVAPVLIPVPCSGCVEVVFCSAKCRFVTEKDSLFEILNFAKFQVIRVEELSQMGVLSDVSLC